MGDDLGRKRPKGCESYKGGCAASLHRPFELWKRTGRVGPAAGGLAKFAIEKGHLDPESSLIYPWKRVMVA